jgi:hypothetical protein
MWEYLNSFGTSTYTVISVGCTGSMYCDNYNMVLYDTFSLYMETNIYAETYTSYLRIVRLTWFSTYTEIFGKN